MQFEDQKPPVGGDTKGRATGSMARPSRVRPGPSTIHGQGLFAATSFAEGQVIGRLEGVLTEVDGPHVLWVTEELGLEVTNDFRFINHSDEPNCELSMSEVTALRPIAAGEELTHDYSGG